MAFLIEQAGGMASTGHGRILEVEPTELHQRVPFIFGSKEEVARIEEYHQSTPDDDFKNPLFNTRGLFRDAS